MGLWNGDTRLVGSLESVARRLSLGHGIVRLGRVGFLVWLMMIAVGLPED